MVDVSAIKKGIDLLEKKYNDAENLEGILNNSVKSLCRLLPDGENKYGDMPSMGVVGFSSFNSRELGKLNIEFSPSKKYNEAVHDYFIMGTLGKVNLKNRTFYLTDLHIYNQELRNDTRKVMNYLGLEEISQKEFDSVQIKIN